MLALGPVGLWTTALDALPVSQAADTAALLEEQGWAALWFGEAYGREAFSNAALLLGATRRMVVATGIANLYGRDAMAMNAAARLLTDQHPDRFVLGIGVSHRPLVERMRGHGYAAPVATMREYLAAMAGATYLAAGGPRPTTVLAALGPKMLQLARDGADGAHPYLTTPEHTALARGQLGAGKLLAVEQGVVLTSDRETFLRRAHAHLEIYTGLPNYRNHWLRLGFSAEDLGRGGSDRLAEALIVHGDEQAVRGRVQQHLDAGADHVCLQVLGEDPTDLRLEDLARLAAALV
ncbi:MAG TPA: TIGR03620 family F420-dependent LLM class oxidoreductase [Mycobacteriales bacterium]|nr:TIGR03620 family F420-dependent LLM class oxidoreductase [Mycobacteriales bacterium]